MKSKIPIFIVVFLTSFSAFLKSQSYFSTGALIFYKINVNSSQCSCSYDQLSTTIPFYPDGISFLPDTTLVISETPYIFSIDTLNGGITPIYTQSTPGQPYFTSLLGVGNGIFYSMNPFDDKLYRININTDEVTLLGSTGYDALGDITLYNGNIYYPYLNGIVLLDTNNTASSFPIVTYPDNYFYVGLTASHVCNSLIGIGGFFGSEDTDISLINLSDGAITHLCMLPEGIWHLSTLTSMLEFSLSPPCNIHLDLDCNDSSGAIGADFNSPSYTCLSDGVSIADEDITMEYDDVITTMTVTASGNVPDAPFEILVSTGAIPGIDVVGSGTGMITLTNAGGARSTDFKDALRLLRYKNLATPLTPGPRTIEVMFTTASGSQSNLAIAFIDVIESPLIDVDLGPDLQDCEGETATFDAGHPGASYTWSTGSHNQTITVDDSGLYSVTVTDGIHCPNTDTVEVQFVPVINVALTGDTEICDNSPANLFIQTNSPFGLTIDIDVDPGSPFHFDDLTGDLAFIDLISQPTTYTISSVTSPQDACIEITDSIQIIDVYPAYIQDVSVALCDGDSIWLGFYWETQAGVYENTLSTFYGCDSMVTTHISILPAIQITQLSTTCDSADAGVFITYLDNPNGCDTVVTSTVTLLPPDTTWINLQSCILANTGITSLSLINQHGCDSVILTSISWIPPSDTTLLSLLTCDSTLAGSFMQILPDHEGCDSMIITTISIAPADTTYIYGISCDTALIGVYHSLLSNLSGCDSLVITTIATGTPDTTLVYSTSCDSASLGVFHFHYISSRQCDSTVISTITYSARDSTFISGTSCDPAASGIFIQSLTNIFGCDSIVTTNISLLHSDATAIDATTCDPAQAGISTYHLVNQYGCDSTVTVTITLLPSDETFLGQTTCSSAEAGTFITSYLNQYGCDSIVTRTVALIPPDTTLLTSHTCDPLEVGHIENLYTAHDGCDSLVITLTSLFTLPLAEVHVITDFNGYAISCFGIHDGSLLAVTDGDDPFAYFWSTGDTTQTIQGLGAGEYNVSITDANGCETTAHALLAEPDPLSISFEVSQPDCFSNQAGTITVQHTGGVAPVLYSIDGISYYPSPTFTDLAAGSYTITALDANDCVATEIIMINVLTDIHVDLGDDQIIIPGDTALIQALINVPFDSLASITWTGLTNPDCPTCLTQMVAPIITTAYTVSVSDDQGCSDLDSMLVSVRHRTGIYVPNVFSPNGDGINDRLLISAGAAVQEIESFTIFDRWGNMMYLNEHFLPNDPGEAWDGTRNGVTLNPGVYAYKLIARFTGGSTQVRYGDVTLIR